MNRLAVGAFCALALATIAAFFVTQHLKVTTPLITGSPRPVPDTINPVSGGTCPVRNPQGVLKPVSYRRMKISFYLLNRPDVVNVYVADPGEPPIATLRGSGRYMRLKQRRTFYWNGRETDGRVAPDGAYEIRVELVQQARTVVIANQNTGAVLPITVQTQPPDLRVTSVTPPVIAAAGRVTIHYTGNQGLRPQIVIVRAGQRRPVKTFAATTKGGTSLWDGTLSGERPAPPGRYVVGLLLVHDRTCNRVASPLSPAAAPAAVVTVR